MDFETGSIRQAFETALLTLAKQDSRLHVVSADLKSSVHLSKFAQKYPSRFVECGVAENNAAGVAAGLAKSGKTVFLVSYACFSPGINWATIKQSICSNHANVKIIGSHAGLLTGELGASHQMLEDIALMRSLPNMQVFSPADAIETEKIVTAVAHSPLPAYVRLVRPTTPSFTDPRTKFTIGVSHILRPGTDLTILGHGPILSSVLAQEIRNLKLEIINCSSIKPLDADTILKSVAKTGRCLVIEDHQKAGGLGESIASLLMTSGLPVPFIHLAVDNRFGQSGHGFSELYLHYGLGPDNIIEAINELCLPLS